MYAVHLIQFVLIFLRALLPPAIRGYVKPACVPPQYIVIALPVPPFFIYSPVQVGALYSLSQGRVAYALLCSPFVLCVLARPMGNCVVDFIEIHGDQFVDA